MDIILYIFNTNSQFMQLSLLWWPLKKGSADKEKQKLCIFSKSSAPLIIWTKLHSQGFQHIHFRKWLTICFSFALCNFIFICRLLEWFNQINISSIWCWTGHNLPCWHAVVHSMNKTTSVKVSGGSGLGATVCLKVNYCSGLNTITKLFM